MRVFDKTKTIELSEYNLYKGYLKDDKILIDKNETYETIQVYIPYTTEEIAKRKEEDYYVMVEAYIREKYSLSAELAILRQRDVKIDEFNEYDVYAEFCKNRAKEEISKLYE